MNNDKYLQLILIPVLFSGISCGRFYDPGFVDFDGASDVCKESRDLVAIESKMIPSDEILNAEAKSKAGEGTVIDAKQVSETNYKLINEGDEERFITIPHNRFASVTLPDGKQLVYWIHFVSSDKATLDDVEDEKAAHYKKINNVLLQFHQSGKLKIPGWERELNETIVKEIQSISKFEKVARVYIHLGC